MRDLRCNCNKILCQMEGNAIVIKCRHCKRTIFIHLDGDKKIEDFSPASEGSKMTAESMHRKIL